MENSNPLSETTFLAEPSNNAAVLDPHSIAGVTARLTRWGRIAPAGLARVDYYSARARQKVLEGLRAEFAQLDIRFEEIELPPDTPAEQHVLRLRETFAALPPCVVSITGMNHAFPADIPLPVSLGTINCNRDTLVHFPLRQIWWMQGDMANIFRKINPDFDRFFLVRVSLTEIPTAAVNPQRQTLLPEGDFLTYEEAKQASRFYIKRFSNALHQKRPLSELMSLCVNAFKPLIQAGRIAEAGECQMQFFAETEQAGYDIPAYLNEDISLAEIDNRDAENLSELSNLRWKQGCYAEAQALVERVLAIQCQLLPAEHPDIASSLNNLALLYESQGRYEEAEPLYQRALTIQVNVRGPDHPDIAASLNNLALLYKNQHRYEEAEPLYRMALAIDEKALGKDHPGTASDLNNLALLYESQGRYEEAEPLYQRALTIQVNVRGPDHPDTASSLNNLAALYESQGRYKEAEPLYLRALAIDEKVLGKDHPGTALDLNNLASLYVSQGRYEEAEPLYQRAVAIDKKVLGPEHPDTKTFAENYRLIDQHRPYPVAKDGKIIPGKG